MTPHAWRRVALASLVGGISAAAAPDPGVAADMPPNMERYSLVLLKRPANPAKVADPEALQQQHLAHLGAMHKAGKLVIAGPGDQRLTHGCGHVLYRLARRAKALASRTRQ
jgi:hypothetical protein